MPGAVPNPTPIIHMTSVENLPDIAARGALRSKAALVAARVQITNIAYSSIQDQRATKRVPCGSGGCLHDYVPFYFSNRSPMLYTISRGNVAGADQAQIVHLVSSAQAVADAGLPFTFSDGHGIMAYSQFYADLDSLCHVDWNTVGSRYWFDTQEDGDRKRRKQAEFLVRGEFPIHLVVEVVAPNAETAAIATRILARSNLNVPVAVRSGWYY